MIDIMMLGVWIGVKYLTHLEDVMLEVLILGGVVAIDGVVSIWELADSEGCVMMFLTVSRISPRSP